MKIIRRIGGTGMLPGGAGGGSVTSAQFTSAVSALSNRISVETAARVSADNVLSNAISALGGGKSRTRWGLWRG